jgi:hypothetical protein
MQRETRARVAAPARADLFVEPLLAIVKDGLCAAVILDSAGVAVLADLFVILPDAGSAS